MNIPLLLNKKKTYQQRIKSLFGTSLIGYWPLNEASGTVAYDKSGNGRNGVYTNVTLGQAGVGDGYTAALFNGTTSKADIYSASFASAFNGNTGTLSVFATSADWASATLRVIGQVFVDASNLIRISAQSGLITFNHIGAGTSKSKQYQIPTGEAGFVRLSITWGASGLIYYVNDNSVSTPATGLGTFAGALSNSATMIGAQLTNTAVWSGNIAHAFILNREATAAEIKSSGIGSVTRFTFLGDSTSTGGDNFPAFVAPGYGRATINNRAVGGQSVTSGMDAQTLAAANDSANIIIIALGTNDDNAGNMTTLQAEAEENIDELKASNPGATIYWMNVLPRWTNSGGGTVVDKAAIRTAIAAACAAQSITCWDTFSTPWITAGDTSDGLHPIVTGARKITQQIWTRI